MGVLRGVYTLDEGSIPGWGQEFLDGDFDEGFYIRIKGSVRSRWGAWSCHERYPII